MDQYRGDVLHSSEYRNGDPWKGRPVLVVGFGNSACEQALDLVERGAEVHVPLLDIGTMEQIKKGHIKVHGDLDRFTEDDVVFSNGSQVTLDAVVLATGYRASIEDFLVGWEAACDGSGTPTVSGAATALQGLHFCGMYVSPAGMLREIGIEATRIATHISH